MTVALVTGNDGRFFNVLTNDTRLSLPLTLCLLHSLFNCAPSTSLTLLPMTLVFLSATTTTTTVSRVSLCSVDDDDHHNHSLIHSHTKKGKEGGPVQCKFN